MAAARKKPAKKRATRRSPSRALRPDRIVFPATGYTKRDAIDYYRRIAPVLLKHLKNRPLSFLRFPDTVDGPSFWEKDAPSFTPDWIRRIDVTRRSGTSAIHYIALDSARGLTWAADVGMFEIHPFLHRAPHVDRATEIVFDLDPGSGAAILDCCVVAELLRDELERFELDSFPKVSGSKGLQVYVPLNGNASHEVTEALARAVAEDLARRNPRQIVARMAKNARNRKVFIDWSQNADFKTTVSVYSLRTRRPAPYVSMPLTWDEVAAALRKRDAAALDFSPDAALARVERRGDLFAPVLRRKQSIPREFEEALASVATRIVPTERVEEEVVVKGIRLPRARSQSGRRLFALIRGDEGNELWLDVGGDFYRWILRPDREGGERLIALHAGHFPVAESWYRGEVQPQYRDRVSIVDIGAYELIEGSSELLRFDYWFTGRTLRGEWVMRKISDEPGHRSWQLAPAAYLGGR